MKITVSNYIFPPNAPKEAILHSFELSALQVVFTPESSFCPLYTATYHMPNNVYIRSNHLGSLELSVSHPGPEPDYLTEIVQRFGGESRGSTTRKFDPIIILNAYLRAKAEEDTGRSGNKR